jgi:hypothetical protein
LAYAELSDLAAHQERQSDVQARKIAFEARTGPFTVEDPWYEARARAFHDDLVTQIDFHQSLPEPCDAELGRGRTELTRAFRGLFRLQGPLKGKTGLLVNSIDQAEYYIAVYDPLLRRALEAIETALFDGRLVASDRQLVLLPGAVLHPEEATTAIDALIVAGKARGLSCGALLDRLLRMEHQLRVRSRVRASHVYRVDALSGPLSRSASRGHTA